MSAYSIAVRADAHLTVVAPAEAKMIAASAIRSLRSIIVLLHRCGWHTQRGTERRHDGFRPTVNTREGAQSIAWLPNGKAARHP
jgi:hypothetical protein